MVLHSTKGLLTKDTNGFFKSNSTSEWLGTKCNDWYSDIFWVDKILDYTKSNLINVSLSDNAHDEVLSTYWNFTAPTCGTFWNYGRDSNTEYGYVYIYKNGSFLFSTTPTGTGTYDKIETINKGDSMIGKAHYYTTVRARTGF
ncbi:hypothetical protein [Aliarcobacter butzleri]|uniref:hypothetical protein n=1 Tax=Aliarcobacter butzleri TaxID=28197 RepID=UPI002B242A6D|nr:hypothetical protein [Aliarcobacter butzleri]